MSDLEDFLSAEEEQDIIEAIRVAEKNTSGEIRVHIERTSNTPIEERTLELFYTLKMDNTKLANGVLFYVAIDDHKFSIYGDKGINDVVPRTFWDSTRDTITSHFKLGEFKVGLVKGIIKAGEQLQTHFPYTNNDINELPDTISKG